jgi:hypothetical protein
VAPSDIFLGILGLAGVALTSFSVTVIMKLISSAASKCWCLASSVYSELIATNIVVDSKQRIKVM